MMVFTSDPFKLYNTNIRDETLFGHMIYMVVCCILGICHGSLWTSIKGTHSKAGLGYKNPNV